MAITHSDGMANNTLDNGFKGAFNTTGVIKIYSGAPPGANNAVTGTLLSTLPLSATAFAAAAGRVSTAAAIASDTSAAASGTAGYFRVKLSGDADASVVRPDGRTDGPFGMANPVPGTYTYIYSPPRLTGENLFTAYVTTTNPNTAAKGEFIVQI